jgi:dCMP deaminase
MENLDKWHRRFLELAKHIAQWSKDPSTKTGAVIVDPFRRVISVGYNGFPAGVLDTTERLNDRETKYKIIVHCERNAILFAQRSLKNCRLYTWPFMSCAPCAGVVIQSGIRWCIAPKSTEDQLTRWGADFNLTKTMFAEANVFLDEVVL